uniref:helix-turn-helix domain-containing protein n=1 Tax=Microbulbifer agarilyticus TaxID=260552 RepID=UPI00025586C8|nr:AraC family transcriptional regulator [Microbulbifer agarilyticus]
MAYLKFSSRNVAASERREVLAETYVPLCGMDVEFQQDALDVEVAVHALTRLAVADSHLTGHRATRTLSHIAKGDNAMVLVLPRDGDIELLHKSRYDTRCKPGELHLLPLDSPFISANPEYVHVTGINLPGAFVERHLVSPDKVINKTIKPANQDAYNLLLGYVDAIHQVREDLSEDSARLADLHIMDLIALSLGMHDELQHSAADRGLTFARFAAMRTYLNEHKHDPTMSAQAVAIHFNLSAQAVRKIFRQHGTTVTDYLNNVRLGWVYDQLQNPVANSHSISSLAYAVGFNNLTWFNRAFKRKFGITPSEVLDFERHPQA